MGASGSTISADLKGKVIAKNFLDEEILTFLGNAKDLPDQVPVEQVMNALKDKTDVFLTHNWGPNQDNHKRVAVINEGLKAKGLLTWFDSEKMEGNVKKKMIKGIDNASCIAVFITQLYIDKVGGDNAEDNCQLEFGYAATKKTASKMVPVVMESGVRNTSAWEGEVCMVLGRMLYVDMCDDVTDAKISELYDRILSVNNGVKLTDLFQKCMTLAMKHATLPSGPIAQQTLNASVVSSKFSISVELYEWMTQTVRITPKAAETYCTILADANIGSVDRLRKRYEKNKNLLAELNIDEFDAEDVVKALVGAAPATLSPSELSKLSATKQLESVGVQPSVATVPSQWTQVASWDLKSSRLKVSPNGLVIAVATYEGYLLIYDPSGRLITTMNETVKNVTCLSFSADGSKLAASCPTENWVKLFEVSSGRLMWSTTLTFPNQVCFFNSSTLVTSQDSFYCDVIDASSGSITSTFKAGARDGLCLSSKGALITAGGGKVSIWDNINSLRLSWECHYVQSMCIHSDGSRIYIGTDGGSLLAYSDSGLIIAEVKKAHGSSRVWSLSMNETNSIFASGGSDNLVKLWNTSTLECIQTLNSHTNWVTSVSFLPNRKLVSGSTDKAVKWSC